MEQKVSNINHNIPHKVGQISTLCLIQINHLKWLLTYLLEWERMLDFGYSVAKR